MKNILKRFLKLEYFTFMNKYKKNNNHIFRKVPCYNIDSQVTSKSLNPSNISTQNIKDNKILNKDELVLIERFLDNSLLLHNGNEIHLTEEEQFIYELVHSQIANNNKAIEFAISNYHYNFILSHMDYENTKEQISIKEGKKTFIEI